MTTAALETKTQPTAKIWTFHSAHTGVAFEAKHLMITRVRGRFRTVGGTLVLDEQDFSRSSVEVTIEAASIDTGHETRDAHLRSADFLEVERYPTLTFRSQRIERDAGAHLRITGDLTIRNVTRTVVLDAVDEGSSKDPWSGERRAFSASTTIDRRDFGLTWNVALETGGVLVGNEIRISLEVQAEEAGA
jgi:polyisoprenoid-binding protein YceI